MKQRWHVFLKCKTDTKPLASAIEMAMSNLKFFDAVVIGRSDGYTVDLMIEAESAMDAGAAAVDAVGRGAYLGTLAVGTAVVLEIATEAEHVHVAPIVPIGKLRLLSRQEVNGSD